MSDVYVDALAVTVAPAAGGRRSVAPGAVDALARLADEGHRVCLLGSVPPIERRLAGTIECATALPEGLRDAWYLTGDSTACDRHVSGCRVIFVGPPPPRTLLTRRCDEDARDLPQAVLRVLLEDVMPVGR